LVYFDLMGRGEPIRLLLNHAGVQFKDERFTFEEWPKIKPTAVGGSLPNIRFEDGTTFG